MTKYNITYTSTKVGRGTIEVNGYLLHSKYDPLKEAIRFVDKEINEQYLTVIFGLGKGYILDVLNDQKYNSRKIVIVEPIAEIEPIVDSKGYTIVKSSDIKVLKEVIEQSLTHFSREVRVICLPNYDKICPEEYKKLLKMVKDIQWLNIVNENTVRGQSQYWQENQIKNTLYAYCGSNIKELKAVYKIPVVVASGGPSLIKQLPLLKEIRSKVILIAAGSTLITLQKEGVTPDYIASIDGNKGNFERHFKNNDIGKAQLIYSFSNYFEIQKYFSNASFAFTDLNQLDLVNQLNERYGLDMQQLEGGGSVANYALSIARYISTGPIAMIGQDLAYTNNQTHAKHNISAEEVTDELIKTRGAFKIEGYLGDEVLTDYSLFSMKKRFEEIIQTIQDSGTIFNCTEGGVKINGINQITFTEFCSRFISSPIEKKLIIPTPKNRDLDNLINIYIKEIKNYNDILIDLKLAVRLLNDVKNQKRFSNKILKELDKIDKNIKKRKENVLMNSILDPIIMDVMLKYESRHNETDKEKYERVLAQNEELYSRLLVVTEQSKSFVEEILDETRKKMRDNNGRNY